jgi:predicted metal-dependent hydrolase
VIEPDPQALPPEQTLREAAALLEQGRAFRAHEVFEATWKATAGEERELWRALAQLAVGITHAQRGNGRGSATLLRRGADNLLPWDGREPYGVPVAALRAWALDAAGRQLPAEKLLATLQAFLGPPLGD